MKLVIPTLAAMLSLFSAGAVVAGERTVTLNVDNMFCDLCPATVKTSLTRVAGVTKAEVSFEKKTAVVTFDDSRTNIPALLKATENAGYPSRLAAN